MDRREAMQSLAALATARWEAEGFDPDAIKEWGALEGGIYTTGDITPERVLIEGEGPVAGWLLEDSHYSNRSVGVNYDSDSVSITVKAGGDDVRGETFVTLTATQAREIAVALFQAAAEWEERPHD